ncbi:hypothetical protein Tco_1022848, partial [Tanacetum coccineum]
MEPVVVARVWTISSGSFKMGEALSLQRDPSFYVSRLQDEFEQLNTEPYGKDMRTQSTAANVGSVLVSFF